MQLKRYPVVHFCLRELLLQRENFTRQIVFRVGGSEQNTRHNRDAARSRSDICADRLINSRTGEFEKAVTHPPPASALPDELNQTFEFTDPFRIPAPMSGDDNVVVRGRF